MRTSQRLRALPFGWIRRRRYECALASFLFLLCAAALPALASEREGVVPLGQARDYPHHLDQEDFSVGVKILSSADIKRLFASTLDDGYIVLELAIYPNDGKLVEVSEKQFILHDDDNRDYARAASAAEVARVLQKSNAKPEGRDLTVYPQVGIGYSTGDRYRRGGWQTSTGVGVAVEPQTPQASTDADRKTMETELQEKGLPRGTLAKPAAGYLYFPLRRRKMRQAKLSIEQRSADTAAATPLFRVDLY